MPTHRDYLRRSLQLSIKGIWLWIDGIAALLGVILACVAWFNPTWIKQHGGDSMNAFWLGVIPLAGGFSVFLLRWLWSGFTIYRQDTESLQSEINLLRSQQVEHREQVMYDCAARLERGENYVQALRASKAHELASNEDLCYICDELAKSDHVSPFAEGGDLFGVAKGLEMAALKDLIKRGISPYDYMMLVLVEVEKINEKKKGPSR